MLAEADVHRGIDFFLEGSDEFLVGLLGEGGQVFRLGHCRNRWVFHISVQQGKEIVIASGHPQSLGFPKHRRREVLVQSKGLVVVGQGQGILEHRHTIIAQGGEYQWR